jgi:hypothetical protein
MKVSGKHKSASLNATSMKKQQRTVSIEEKYKQTLKGEHIGLWPGQVFVIVLQKSYYPAFNVHVCKLFKSACNMHRLTININCLSFYYYQ